MNRLLGEVRQALIKERYTFRSFARAYGFSNRTVDKTLLRITKNNYRPRGEKALEIIAKIKEVTGYDLLSKLGGGRG